MTRVDCQLNCDANDAWLLINDTLIANLFRNIAEIVTALFIFLIIPTDSVQYNSFDTNSRLQRPYFTVTLNF